MAEDDNEVWGDFRRNPSLPFQKSFTGSRPFRGISRTAAALQSGSTYSGGSGTSMRNVALKRGVPDKLRFVAVLILLGAVLCGHVSVAQSSALRTVAVISPAKVPASEAAFPAGHFSAASAAWDGDESRASAKPGATSAPARSANSADPADSNSYLPAVAAVGLFGLITGLLMRNKTT